MRVHICDIYFYVCEFKVCVWDYMHFSKVFEALANTLDTCF